MKKIKDLSLIISGVILGLGLSFSPQIYAATSSLLGSKVDKVISVKLDKVELGKAIAIDGVSYLPVRSLSTALDVGVDYTSSEINLTSSKGATTMEVAPETTGQTTLTNDEKNVKKDEINSKIGILKMDIQGAKDVLSNKESSKEFIVSLDESIQRLYRMKDNNSPGYSEEKVNNIQAQIDKTKKNLSDAETNLPIWEAELIVLEAELAALK